MKKIYSIIAGVLLTASVFAQAPQKMSYQAVIRNSSSALVTSTPVGMKISILQGTATGTTVYIETQIPSTNANGLVSLEIGSGTPVTGTFAGINWANGPYFIKTETDPTGGTAYTIAGTNQLMSVPYALFSANGTPGATGAEGSAGTNGTNGAVGATGATGATGSVGTLSAIGATPNANGATLTGQVLNLEPANANFGGVVTTGTQTFAGAKTFSVDAIVNGITVGRGLGNIESNTAVGLNSLNSNTTGGYNTANGMAALYYNTTGNQNTANGANALYNNTTGSNNTANGANALNDNTTGGSNTANGMSALYNNTEGSNNTANGMNALYNTTTGSYNTANGANALNSNTTGYENTANGIQALYSTTTGYQNTANGMNALYSNTNGVQNTANGVNALYSNTSGTSNTANGVNALYYTTGTSNTATGHYAGLNITTGNNNTALGSNTGNGIETGSGNTILGANVVGLAATLSNNIILANGTGAIKAQHDDTDWTLTGGLTAGGITYPKVNGANGQVLTTNGSGLASWAAPVVGGFTHYLGEAFNDGIIYYLYKGSDGLEHGLIVALTESTAAWQTTDTLVNANRTEDGAYNTDLMTGNPAATYITGLGAGWYLPSIDELGLLYYNRYSAQKGLRAGGNTLLSNNANYWSSTEYNATNAYYFSFYNGYANYYGKALTYTVRGVRAF